MRFKQRLAKYKRKYAKKKEATKGCFPPITPMLDYPFISREPANVRIVAHTKMFRAMDAYWFMNNEIIKERELKNLAVGIGLKMLEEGLIKMYTDVKDDKYYLTLKAKVVEP